jgi:hypothetical protein
MDDFMGKAEMSSKAEQIRIKEFRELTNRRFRCVASRIKNQEERVDICMRISVLAFVASIAALVIALVV